MSKPKTLSDLFTQAAKRIEVGHNFFICEAIGSRKSFPSEVRARAKEIIKERLGGHLYYTEWVRANHPDLYRKSRMENTWTEDKKQGRIAWCLALAEEFKEAA
jgi:hypothetical protein